MLSARPSGRWDRLLRFPLVKLLAKALAVIVVFCLALGGALFVRGRQLTHIGAPFWRGDAFIAAG